MTTPPTTPAAPPPVAAAGLTAREVRHLRRLACKLLGRDRAAYEFTIVVAVPDPWGEVEDRRRHTRPAIAVEVCRMTEMRGLLRIERINYRAGEVEAEKAVPRRRPLPSSFRKAGGKS